MWARWPSKGYAKHHFSLCAWVDLLDAVCVSQIGFLKAPGCSAQNTRELEPDADSPHLLSDLLCEKFKGCTWGSLCSGWGQRSKLARKSTTFSSLEKQNREEKKGTEKNSVLCVYMCICRPCIYKICFNICSILTAGSSSRRGHCGETWLLKRGNKMASA